MKGKSKYLWAMWGMWAGFLLTDLLKYQGTHDQLTLDVIVVLCISLALKEPK